MREVTIKLNEEDYLRFLSEANESGLKPDEKLNEIVQYYILVNKKRYSPNFTKKQLGILENNDL